MDSNIIGSIIGACATILAALIGLIGIIITIKKKKTNDSRNITQNAQGNNITQIGTLIQNDVRPITKEEIDAIINEQPKTEMRTVKNNAGGHTVIIDDSRYIDEKVIEEQLKQI